MLNPRPLVLLAAILSVLGLCSWPVAAQQKTTIGVSLAQDDNPFYIAMLKGIRERAQELGWEVVTVSANEDKAKQIAGVQDLVARGVQGILISPIDAVGVNAAYDAAKAGNIPIVSVARGSTSPNQTLHVAMDETQIGRDIAEWTAKAIADEGKVAMLLGPSGVPTFRNLGDGYAQVMAKYPKIQIIIRADGPLTRERGVKQAEDALVANPDLKAIYAANDDVALGAMQAVLAADRSGKTIVTGMN
jgi:ribose transport system substrate-binding protein